MNSSSIVPHLWFDNQAKEAAAYYCTIFPESNVTTTATITGTPSGDVDIVSFHLWGLPFMSISAGPLFKFNESASFYVYCGSEHDVEHYYKQLSQGGSVLMELKAYPWSKKYAWVKDRYGLHWQLDVDAVNSPQKIVPALLFTNENAGRVKEAITHYCSIFKNSKVLVEAPHDPSAGMPAGTLLFAQVKLDGYLLNAMSSSMKHDFGFNEAVSYMVYCNNQDEIDYYWEAFTQEGIEQPCGWVKDKFGVSWQVVPHGMDAMMQSSDREKRNRVTEAMLKMKRINLAVLQEAYDAG